MFYTKSFVLYTKEISSSEYDPLSKEEERELLIKIENGDKQAKERMIKAHLRFVVYLLRDIKKIPTSMDPMDLIQEGNLGLLKGLDRFDPKFGVRVFTYVQHYIRWYMNIALGMYTKTIEIQELQEDFDFDDLASEEKIEEKVHQDILEYIKTFLDVKEAKVISLLFGLEPPFISHTAKSVGSLFHVGAEWIRQIKLVALEKIKEKQDQINLLK
jgi:RNA polymerase primary sigma factor